MAEFAASTHMGMVAKPRRAMVSNAAVAWCLTMPAIATYLMMILIPTLAVMALAFTDYDFGAPSFRWIGLDNFAEMLGDRKFKAAISNTALYCLFVVPLSIGIALLLAVLIEAGVRGRALFRAIFFLPVVSLTVAMATVWQYLLHPSIGPVTTSCAHSACPRRTGSARRTG